MEFSPGQQIKVIDGYLGIKIHITSFISIFDDTSTNRKQRIENLTGVICTTNCRLPYSTNTNPRTPCYNPRTCSYFHNDVFVKLADNTGILFTSSNHIELLKTPIETPSKINSDPEKQEKIYTTLRELNII